MNSKFNQLIDLSDYSKFYEEEDKENMIELFFDIFKNLKKNNSSNLLSDSSTINYSESDSLNSSDSPLDSLLDSSDSLDKSVPNSSLIDYDINAEPIIDFVFNESQIYKDNSNDLSEPINLPSVLTNKYDSIQDQLLELRKLYNRIRHKIVNLKNQNDDLINCISALNRIVIQLDQHSSKICLLPKLSNLKLNIKEYKDILSQNQSTSSSNSIQQMIDLFYTSYLEFDIITQNCKSDNEFTNYSNKLQSNLEYLRNVYPQYKNLKNKVPIEFSRCRSSIKILRYNIVKDLIDVIIQLSSDECYQLFNGFTQHNLIISFKRLLKTIS